MDNRYYELSDDSIKDFMDIFNRKSFPIAIKFLFIGDSKSKKLIKISKIADDLVFVMGKELKITMNEDLFNVYDEESIVILIEQEIDKIHHNLDSGKIKLVSTNLNTFSSILSKYGIEKVARANQIEELYQEQKNDASVDEKSEIDEFII